MQISKISIILCTRNRAQAITACLESIARAVDNTKSIPTELIVIDNASTDDTYTIVRRWADAAAFDVNLIKEPKPGLSTARNTAMKAASGNLFVLTDDDCIMDASYLNSAIRLFSADNELVFRGGRVELGDPTDLPVSIITTQEKLTWRRQPREGDYLKINGRLMGANLMIPLDVYQQVGTFDETIGAGRNIPSAEDTDYIYRAYLANIRIEYVPDCVVHHFHGRKDILQVHKLMSGYGQGTGALYAKYFFKFPYFCRQALLDFKVVLGGLLRGQPYMIDASIGYTFNSWFYNTMVGFMKFVKDRLQQKL